MHAVKTNQPRARSDRFANTYKGGDRQDDNSKHQGQREPSVDDYEAREVDSRELRSTQGNNRRDTGNQNQRVERYYQP